jgi:hypothetical protein
MKSLKSILFISFCLIAAFVSAQAKFYAQGASNSYVGADYKVVFVIENAEASNFKAPNFDDFQALSGPNQSKSYQYYNGNYNHSLSIYYYLRPKEEGTFTIGKASVKINGETWFTNEIIVEVGPAKQQNAQQNNSGGGQNQAFDPSNSDEWKKQAKENIFIRLYTDNTTPYVGEQVFVYAKLYQRINSYGSQVTEMPDFEGFWKQDIELKDNKPQYEEYQGKQYQTMLIGKYALFPLKEGRQVIDPVKMNTLLLVSVPKVVSFMGMQIQTMEHEQFEYNYASNELLLDVQPLPQENKPLDFIGAVGEFELETLVDSLDLQVGNPLHFTTTIRGTGNIMAIQEPVIDFPRQLEVYDPETKEQISKQSNRVNGSKTYNYILVPTKPGNYTIPGVSFSYFDVNKEDYISLLSYPIEIKVNGDVLEIVENELDEEGEEEMRKEFDLFDIYKTSIFTDVELNFYDSWRYPLSLASPFVAYFLFLFGARLKEEFKPDTITMKYNRASKEAVKRLKQAKIYLDQQNQQAFYNEVFDAFNGYVSDKLNINQAELSKEFVLEKFSEKNVSAALVEQFEQVLRNAEEALYSPQSFGKMQEDYLTAIDWIVKIEHEIS